VVVVVVLPLLELVVEHPGVVDNHSVEEPVELLGVDAVRTRDFVVEAGRGLADVGVADADCQQPPSVLELASYLPLKKSFEV
jgi:hypothetical protein